PRGRRAGAASQPRIAHVQPARPARHRTRRASAAALPRRSRRRPRDRMRGGGPPAPGRAAPHRRPLDRPLRGRDAARGRRPRGGERLPRRGRRGAGGRRRIPGRLPPDAGRGRHGLRRTRADGRRAGPRLHARPRGPPPGPPPRVGPHLEHVPGPRGRRRVRDPQVGRRPRPAQRLRHPRRSRGRAEDRAAEDALPEPAYEGVVRRRHVPGAPAPAWRRGGGAVRGGVHLPQAGLVTRPLATALAGLVAVLALGCEARTTTPTVPPDSQATRRTVCPPDHGATVDGRCLPVEEAYVGEGGTTYWVANGNPRADGAPDGSRER